MMVRDPFTPRLRTLRQMWNETAKEGVPERFKELLDSLDKCPGFRVVAASGGIEPTAEPTRRG